jgi:AcrR family transcriptional regulator
MGILVAAGRTMDATRTRSTNRQVQIAQTTLRLIANHGLSGVSLARIACLIGVTDAALYKHYASKDDILIAAYDLLAERVFRWIHGAPGQTTVDRLRALGESHASLFSQDINGFNVPMSQFNVWIPKDRVRQHVDKTHRMIMDSFVRMIEEGKAEGCIRDDTDAEVVVSEIYAWIWWEDLSYLRGLDPKSIAKGSGEMFNRMLSDIVV